MRSLEMEKSGPRGAFFRLLMIIGMIAAAGGLSPAEAKHGTWLGTSRQARLGQSG